MDLQTRKIDFLQEFLKVKSEEVVLKLEKLLKKESSASTQQDFKPMSAKDFNNRIDKSM